MVLGHEQRARVRRRRDVLVDYDPLPVIIDPEEALEDGAPIIHEDHGTNKVLRVVARAATSKRRSPARTS